MVGCGSTRPTWAGRCRAIANKAIVAIAVEVRGNACGRVRMRRLPRVAADTLVAFVTDTVASGWVDDRDGGDAEALLPTVVETDAPAVYCPLSAHGYAHVVVNQSESPDPAHVTMPHVHRVASLLKSWLLGTHQGGVQQRHLDAYLDEFVFRFNRRTSRDRGKLFYRLIELATQHEQTTYRQLVDGPNPQPA